MPRYVSFGLREARPTAYNCGCVSKGMRRKNCAPNKNVMRRKYKVKMNGVNGAGPSGAGSAPDTGVVGAARSVTRDASGNVAKLVPTDGMGRSFRVASFNVGTMRGRSLEVVGILSERRVDVCCLQEVRWKGAGAKVLETEMSKYKIYWIGGEKGEAGVGIMVKQKWIDRVMRVER